MRLNPKDNSMPTSIDNRSARIDAPFTPSAGSVEAFRDAMRPLQHPALNESAWSGRNAGGEVRDVSGLTNVAQGEVRHPSH
jgi:hypothetical protein